MYHVIRSFKQYLEKDCRFPHEAVVNYLGNLPMILDNLNINSIHDIDVQKVSREWKYKRWVETAEGITLSDAARNGYLPTLKLFLEYLEKKDYPVQKGMAEIIKLPNPTFRNLTPLTADEQKQLREFLLFHVNSDLQRRDTALTLLVWSTGCTLSEAIALHVHEEGIIKTNGIQETSGDFRVKNATVYVTLRGAVFGERTVPVPEDALAFINFYLENRNFVSSILFARLTTRGPVKRISESTARKSVERVFKKAGIRAPEGRADELLRLTALSEVPEHRVARSRNIYPLSPETRELHQRFSPSVPEPNPAAHHVA